MLLLTGAASCGKARPVVLGQDRCVTWTNELSPIFAQRCQSCHSGASPAGGYDTTTYEGVLGPGSDDVPNAQADEADSRLVQVLNPQTASDPHRALVDLYPLVREWVVECDLSLTRSTIHPGGIQNPAENNPDFHGALLRSMKYDFSVCQPCHGQDFAGGASGVSCLTCHQEGPTACSTCHSRIGEQGSHRRHIAAGPLGRSFDCSACHVKPTEPTQPGHYLQANGELDLGPAEVVFGDAPVSLANVRPSWATVTAPAVWDPEAKTCANVYCHGGAVADTAASRTTPRWDQPGTGQASCGTCHGLPPNGRNDLSCAACHSAVVARSGDFVDAALHVDGQVELAPAGSGCAGCHGSSVNAAPPPDLSGATERSAVTVGAHQAHLQGTARLRGPISCGECHVVPAEVSSPGHLGGHAEGEDEYPAEVFPVITPPRGTLAEAGGATPAWERGSGTCSDVYCHGGGAALAVDASGVDRAPRWTATGPLVCGTACHGVPPTNAPHTPTMTLTSCAGCHSGTTDAAGNIIITGAAGAETSAHMNGVIDVQ